MKENQKFILHALGKRVIIRPDQQTNSAEEKFYIPETAREKSNTGEVLSIGEECPSDKTSLKVGDKVIYSKNAGAELKHKDLGDLLIVRYDDCFCYLPIEGGENVS
jgi:chaperonin GroES